MGHRAEAVFRIIPLAKTSSKHRPSNTTGVATTHAASWTSLLYVPFYVSLSLWWMKCQLWIEQKRRRTCKKTMYDRYHDAYNTLRAVGKYVA